MVITKLTCTNSDKYYDRTETLHLYDLMHVIRHKNTQWWHKNTQFKLTRWLFASLFAQRTYMLATEATTKKRYSDTTIQRYTEPEPELEPCINYANYCLQSPRETSVITFSRGGRIYLKIFLISNDSLSMFNRLKYWHAQSDNLAYFLTYYVVDNLSPPQSLLKLIY